jgi:hypothetical protein
MKALYSGGAWKYTEKREIKPLCSPQQRNKGMQFAVYSTTAPWYNATMKNTFELVIRGTVPGMELRFDVTTSKWSVFKDGKKIATRKNVNVLLALPEVVEA